MNLDTLERYLRQQAQGGTLFLSQDSQAGDDLCWLLAQCRTSPLPVEDWRLERAGSRLVLTGRAALPAIAQGQFGQLTLEFTQSGTESVEMSFALEYPGPLSMEECFGPLAPGHAFAEGMLKEIPSPLAVCTATRLRLHAESEQIRDSGVCPFAFTCSVRIAEDDFWSCFPGWNALAVQAAGWVDLTPMWNGGLRVWMELPLPGGTLPSGLLKCGRLALLVDSGAEAPFPDRPSWERTCSLDVRCELELTGCETPIFVTAALLAGSEGWDLTAEFPDGLTIADIGRTVLSLMGLEDKTALSLPQGMALGALGLYLLRFEFWGDPPRLRHLLVCAGTTRPLTLPLNCLTLEKAGIQWAMTWGKDRWKSHLFQIYLTGQLRLTLPSGLVLRLQAQAYLPDLELSAHLDAAQTVPAAEVLGGPAKSLPIGSLPLLSGVELSYFQSSRSLSVSAWADDLIRFSLGGVGIALTRVYVRVALSPRAASFRISGLFRLTPAGRKPFALSLSASYADSAWLFQGRLADGQADIGGLLTGLLGIQWSGGPSLFVLSGLDLSYRTDTGVFSLTAAFHQDWGLVFGKTKTASGGRLALRSGNGQDPQVSAMLYLSIGVFQVSVQVDNFYDEATRRFLFQLQLDNKALRAVYEKRNLGGILHEILSLELRNVTLGDLVLLLVRMVNPNHRYTLPAPWNLLNRIDLSRFRLEADLTDSIISLFYRLDLTIPGLFRLKQVGLRYQDGRLFFVVDSEEAGTPQRYEWDALYQTPPDAAQKKGSSIHLYYLGAASHYTTPALREAVTVEEALAAMEEGMAPSSGVPAAQFDPESGWSLGMDLEVDELFHLQLLFHDPTLYGARLDVSATRPPLNFFKGLSVTLLYRRISRKLGVFQAALILPERLRSFQFGIFGVTFGTISLSVYTNGDFLLDLGYPHGGDFSRSFSLLVGKYYAQGGFYFGVLSQASAPALPASDRGKFSKALSLGVGLSIEFGQRFDLGIVKGGLTLGVMGLFEGLFAIFHGNDGNDTFFYQVEATVGFTGRLFLSVDLKIIAIHASLTISAQARAALTAFRPLELELALALRLSAHIRILFFKINFSFDFSTTFCCTLGETSPAPWDSLPASRTARPPLPLPRAARLPYDGDAGPLRLTVTPLFSLEEGGDRRPCAAFLPVLSRADFCRLFDLLGSWLMTVLPETVLPEDAEQLTEDWLDAAFSYEILCAFLAQNLPVTLSAAGPDQNAAEEDGCVTPMPPPVSLTFSSQEGDAFQVSYWLDNLVDSGYAARLLEYFEAAQPDPTRPAPSSTFEDAGQTPLAQLVFLDYFHMLIRQLAGQLKNAFHEYALDSGRVSRSHELCGVEPAALLAANPQLRLQSGTLTLKGAPLILTEAETFRSLARRCGCATEALWDLCGEQTNLLRQGASFTLGGSFDNRKPQMPLRFCAACCFVRRHETALSGGWLSLAQALAESNPSLPGGTSWEAEAPGEVTLDLLGQPWSALPGDTLERLAKALAVNALADGQFPLWDAFWSQIQTLNPGGPDDTPPQIRLPEEVLSVDGDSTIAALGRRLFPQEPRQVLTALEDCPLFEPLRQVRADQILTFSEESTLADLSESAGLPLEHVAQAAAETTDSIVPGQTVLVRQSPFLRRELLPELFALGREQAAGMVSRFLLQGLRLPAPDGNGNDTLPYYKLLRQQAPAGTDRDWTLTVEAQPGCGWVTGAASVTLSGLDIAGQLPDPAPDWKAGLVSLVQSPSFSLVPRYYSPAVSLRLLDGESARAIHLLEGTALAALPQMTSGVTALLEGREAPAVPCLLLPFTVRRKEGQDLLADGADAEDQARLLSVCAHPELPLSLCVRTSRLQTEGTLSILPSGGVALVRVNLSLETHRTPVRQAENTDELFCASLEDGNFSRLLWECGGVGGGFILRLSSPLPEDAFDPDGTAQLWLYGQNAAPEIANALLTPLPGAGGSFGLGSVSFKPSSDTEALADSQPLLPRGRYGMELTLKAPGEAETPENRTRRLFSILDYQVAGSAYAAQSKDSLPLFPQNTPEGEWLYQPVVPLSHLLAQPSDNPYDALGKEARFLFSCRDVLGNRSPGTLESPAFVPAYNDTLTGVHQWPCCRMGYTLLPSSQGPVLELTLFSRTAEEQADNTTAQRLALSLEQLSRTEVVWFLTCTLLPEPLFLTDAQRDDILAWGQRLLAWLSAPGDAPPEPAVIPLLLTGATIPGPEPKPLWVRLHAARTSFLPAEATQYPQAHLDETISQIDPLIGPEHLSCETFAAKLEEALPQAKLARPQETGSDFYLVPIGPEGLLRSISIRPAEVFSQGRSAPRCWAPAPLSNRYLSGGVQLFTLNEDGSLGQVPVNRQYAQVDINAWADRFLLDLEGVFSAQGGRGGVLAPETMAELLRAKQLLAQRAAGQLIPVQSGVPADDPQPRSILQDRLLRDLSLNNSLACIASYQLAFSSASHVRLTAQLAAEESGGESGLEASPGKVDSALNSFCILYCANDRARTGFTPKLTMTLTELEYDIQPQADGYESSRWLTFVLPLKSGTPLFQACLDSDLTIPNPLRRCPTPPLLTGQSFEFSPDSPSQWRYDVQCEAELFEQDRFQFEITFSSRMMVHARSTGSLFHVLAQYEAIRGELLAKLSEPDEILFRNALSVLARLTRQAAEAWGPVAEPARNTEGTTCRIAATPRFAGGRFSLDTSGDWPGAEALPTLESQTPGERGGFTLRLPGLSLFQQRAAQTRLQTFRNHDLLHLRGDGEVIETAERFQFRTETISLPPLNVSRQCRETVLIARLPGPISREALDRASGALLDWLALPPKEGLLAGLSASYRYRLDGVAPGADVTLPVCLIPLTAPQDLAKNLPNTLWAWFSQTGPSVLCPALLFRVAVEDEDGPLLDFDCLRIEFDGETDL